MVQAEGAGEYSDVSSPFSASPSSELSREKQLRVLCSLPVVNLIPFEGCM